MLWEHLVKCRRRNTEAHGLTNGYTKVHKKKFNTIDDVRPVVSKSQYS